MPAQADITWMLELIPSDPWSCTRNPLAQENAPPSLIGWWGVCCLSLGFDLEQSFQRLYFTLTNPDVIFVRRDPRVFVILIEVALSRFAYPLSCLFDFSFQLGLKHKPHTCSPGFPLRGRGEQERTTAGD
jgi:hypothetical protein